MEEESQRGVGKFGARFTQVMRAYGIHEGRGSPLMPDTKGYQDLALLDLTFSRS